MSRCLLPAVPGTAVPASSLPDAPSASLPLLSQKRDQHGEWRAIKQAFRDTAAEDAVSLTTSGSGLASSLSDTLQNTKDKRLARKRPTKQTR